MREAVLMAVTDRDRAHFATIARAMAEEKREQIERAARQTTADGILVGLQLAAAWPERPETRASDDRRAAGQLGLRLRAAALRAARSRPADA